MSARTPDGAPEHDAELARLADGSLPPARRDALRARVDASPQLASSLAEQERALALIRGVDTAASPSLRARVDQMTADAAPRRGDRRRHWTVRPAAAVLAAVAVVAVVAAAVVGGTSATRAAAPTVPQTVHLALAAATLPAPAVDPAHRDRLTLAVGGVPFPRYPGWTTSGVRIDALGGRRIVTVFYTRGGRRVGYEIVSGRPLSATPGRPSAGYGPGSFTVARHGAAELVTWVQGGHTCVIAGRSVSRQTLLELAGEAG